MASSIQLKKEREELDEKKQVEDWRRYIFRSELEKTGVTEIMADDIEALVHSKANWEDVKYLVNKNCPPDLIIKILA